MYKNNASRKRSITVRSRWVLQCFTGDPALIEIMGLCRKNLLI
jgi:hypothetical protein